jgi:hypothetical protein
MKLERVNGLLSFLGNIAILLGLIALAVEINDNTAAVRAQELGALADQDRERQLAMLDPDVRAFYVKSLYSPEELTLDELMGMTSYLSYRVGVLGRTHQAYLDGIVRPADWEVRLLDVPIFLGSPFGQLWWDSAKADYADIPEFVDAIDQAIATSPVVPDDEFLLDLQSRARSLER